VRGSRRGLAIALAVAVPLVAYPWVVVAGGLPTFPGDRDECARVATRDEQGAAELVFGHLASVREAEALHERLVAAGFTVWVEPDGCGFWKVTDDTFGSLAEGAALAVKARTAGFRARLELDPEP
jgi:hypothetical protein